MKKWAAYLAIFNFHTLDFFPPSLRKQLSAPSFAARCLRCIKYYLSYLKSFLLYVIKPKLESAPTKGKYCFFVATKNQKDCLTPIMRQLQNSIFIGTGFQQTGEKIYTLPLGLRWIYCHSFFHICFKVWQRKPQKAIRYFDFIMKTMGMYECFVKHLAKFPPKAIILANDHYYIHRVLLFAAKSLQIPTIYIQHASVSRHFPALKFDLSLLEGQDTLDKYKICGPIEGQVAFIGMPKFDGYQLKRNIHTQVKTVGVCCSPLDEDDIIFALVNRLVNEISDITVYFRKHPGDKREFQFEHLQGKIHISNPLKEKALDFLTKQDLIVAGNSSIHLEAILLNVESLLFRMDRYQKMGDYYGFVTNGLSLYAHNLEEVVDIIRQKKQRKEDVYHRAKYYNYLIDTPYEGKSAELAASYIEIFVNKGTLPKELSEDMLTNLYHDEK